MNGNFVIGLGQSVMLLVLELAGPLLVAGLLVGLIVSVFQATTQIQEQTLSFIPKIAIVGIILALTGPWMLQQIMAFTVNILGNLQNFIR
ncbi:MAG: flagellar biosynthesis protein FliQ [Bacilli bacterium]